MRWNWFKFITIFLVLICGLSLSACAPTPPTSVGPGHLYKPHSNHHKMAPKYVHDQPTANKDLWQHIRSDFTLPDYSRIPQVQQQIAWYENHPAYFQRMATRAAPYMYYIFDQAKQRNLPSELVLLPTIESAYNPFARSYAGASGLWQLMPNTAQNLGIKGNYWFDGRRDVFSSTKGALNYLNYLCDFFNHDWLLAIAAYDSGEGTVLNAIQRNIRAGRATDFWSLPLPAETQSYVPRLLAVAAIINDPNHYGLPLPYIKDEPYLTAVAMKNPINMSAAAKMCGVTPEWLHELNPGVNHATLVPRGEAQLVLPVDKVNEFEQRLINYHPQTDNVICQSTITRHKVQHGETLASIAHKYHISLQKLRATNGLHSNHLKPGQVVLVPHTPSKHHTAVASHKHHQKISHHHVRHHERKIVMG